MPSVAIVHDALVNRGGAERVVATLHEIFPDAPIYTSVYLPDHTHSVLRSATVRTTPLQRIAPSERALKAIFPLTYWAMRQLDLSAYDVVLSSSTYCAKNVRVRDGAVHVCYCYAPLRPVWETDVYLHRVSWTPVAKTIAKSVFAAFRPLDRQAAQRPDHLIAISKFAARKIAKSYRRQPAKIIYPAVDVSGYRCEASDGYFLVVSRLVAYKRVDVAVRAFTQLGLPLRIVGTGPDVQRLKQIAGPNVEFLGALTEDQVRTQYSRCECLIFPGEEDFGLTPLEAHASGKPVIAFAGGGAQETVVGIDAAANSGTATGVFFHDPTPEALMQAVGVFLRSKFHADPIRQHAFRFDVSVFREQMLDFIARVSSSRAAHATNT